MRRALASMAGSYCTVETCDVNVFLIGDGTIRLWHPDFESKDQASSRSGNLLVLYAGFYTKCIACHASPFLHRLPFVQSSRS